VLELDDIQSGVLRPRPTPYVATYIAFRIDERKAGRELMQRIARVVTSADNPNSPLADTWVSVAITHAGFQALGVPQESLDSLAWEFRQGMAARAKDLGDTGESAPENWEKPLGTGEIHVLLVAVSRDEGRLEAALEPARKAYRDMSGIEAIWRQNCHALPTETEPFGFRDGISHPAIEGSGIPWQQSAGTAAQGGRVCTRLPRRAGRDSEDRARSVGSQWNLRRIPQAAPACGRLPAFFKS
jgi:deferrochelatase/peroxidase EfeB